MIQSSYLACQRASAIALLCLAACNGSEEPRERPEDAGQTGACKSTPDYFAGMQASGDGGTVVKLLDSQPAPPVATGQNTWTVELRDTAGATIDGATIVARPWMPAHGHGESPPLVTALGDGRYRLSPVYFRMSGLWEITFEITLPDQTSDSPVIALCIRG
ncbi:MAG TPA: FixH family protein [Polyangiaceae bacterium]